MNVLLVDDHRLMLEGLTNLLTAHGIHVVGMAHDGLEAVARARALQPDVILMDIRMPHMDGLAATRIIRTEMPDAKILILTTSAAEDDLFEAIKSGAFGYLLKTIDAAELIECLDEAQHGVPPFAPGLAAQLLKEFARQSMTATPSPESRSAPEQAGAATGLTPRQKEVLGLVAQGLTYKEVGAKLGVTARTVKYHMAEIMEQLHLDNRAQVIAYAARLENRP